MENESPGLYIGALLEFMFRLGQALLAAGEQTAQVELILRRMASAYGVRRSRVVTFPTAIFISLHDRAEERVSLAEGPGQTLRLDQIADVYELGDAAQRGALAPDEGLARLTAVLQERGRFGIAGTVVGHMILSVGVSMVLVPSPTYIAVAAVLGAVVGGLRVVNRNQPVLAMPLPVVAAGIVSVLVFLAVKHSLPAEPLYALVPPLVSFLPGAMLTLGMVELVYGDMVSGASRLMTGIVQLVLLAFGLAAGAALVGISYDRLIETAGELDKVAWAPWLGVVVFGVGVHLHFSAPRNALWWMLFVLLLTFSTQRAAAAAFGKEISGFFGMLVATPLGYLIQLRFKGPPAMVTFLPSFWLLVPGALGLLSMKHMLSNPAAGVKGLMSAVFALVSIALGTLVGAALYRWLTETFGGWQLQIGRVGSYVRRRRKR